MGHKKFNVKFKNLGIGVNIPVSTLISACNTAKNDNFTHVVIIQDDQGIDTLIDIKVPKGDSFFKYVRKIIKNQEFRFLDLRKDFEEIICRWHPGAKSLACEN